MPRPIIIASMMRLNGQTGVQTHMKGILEWLSKSDRISVLITPFSSPSWLIYPIFGFRFLLEKVNSEIGVWWYRYWHQLFLRLALRKHLNKVDSCIIYAQCPLSACAALKARKNKSQKILLIIHFNISQAEEWADKSAIKRFGKLFNSILLLESSVLPQVDGLIFVSQFIKSEIFKRIPDTKKLAWKILPNFIIDSGLPIYKNNQHTLINIGSLETRKNQRYALEIVQAANTLGAHISLTFVGDGPDRLMLESYAVNLGIENQIIFKGLVPNGVSIMCGKTAYLHVAKMESFGIVLIEAMSMGLPIFAPSVGGIPEVFEDGVEGRFIPLHDSFAAARSILEWLNDDRMMIKAQIAARNCFLKKYNVEHIAPKLLEFMEQTAN